MPKLALRLAPLLCCCRADLVKNQLKDTAKARGIPEEQVRWWGGLGAGWWRNPPHNRSACSCMRAAYSSR